MKQLRASPHGPLVSANNVGWHFGDQQCRPTRRTDSRHQPQVWHDQQCRHPSDMSIHKNNVKICETKNAPFYVCNSFVRTIYYDNFWRTYTSI